MSLGEVQYGYGNREFLQKHINSMYEKIKNGDTETKFQIGAQSFTEEEWDKLLEKFDSAEDEIRAAMREEHKKREEEALKKKLLNSGSFYENIKDETMPDSVEIMDAYRVMSSRNIRREKPVYENYESKRYRLVADNEAGCFQIYIDGESAGAFFYSDINIKRDQMTGTEVLLSSHGTGWYDVIPVDEELKNALKEAMGVEELETVELTGYKVKTHSGTGIQYVMKDGDEGRGGKVLLRNEADVARYNALAEEYYTRYPNLVTNQEFGRIYASFEICGMAERTETGILRIGYDSISFSDNDNPKNNWCVKLTGDTWESLYEWLEKNREQIKEIQKFQSWMEIFEEIDGTYERIWSDEELKQGYLNN